MRYSCNLAEDQACEDSATITASWSGIRATSTARLTKQVAPTARFVATGCQAVAGPRPQSSATTNAPRVGAASTVTVTPGSPFGLQVPFDDDQDDEREAIVQLNGQSTHYRCPLSAGELRDKRIELSRLSVEAGFPPGVYLLYVAVRDAAQNVSGYSVVTLSIGSGVLFRPCEAGEFQVIGALPSGPTQFYTRANGLISGYDYGAADLRLTIVYRTSVAMDLTGCQALRLRGGASGGAVGWDNCLLIEARGLNGGPLLAAWNYCSTDTAPLRDASGATVRRPAAPTVAGNTLSPPIPSMIPFGFPSGQLDLLTELPQGLTSAELTFYVLDWGTVGSTTEVWLSP